MTHKKYDREIIGWDTAIPSPKNIETKRCYSFIHTIYNSYERVHVRVSLTSLR